MAVMTFRQESSAHGGAFQITGRCVQHYAANDYRARAVNFCHSAVVTTLYPFEAHTCMEICQMAFPATKAPAMAQPAMTSNAIPKVYDDPATATNVRSALSESWSKAAESLLMPPAHHSSISLF